MTSKRILSAVLGVLLALLMGEVFFSAWGNSRDSETRALNHIPEEETWMFTGGIFTPPALRSAYQGPVGNPRDFLEDHAELGYRLRPHLRALPGKLLRGGATIYDVTYSTDRFGWRRTPEVPTAAKIVAFFGDSYVFGHGLKEEETLAARFSQYSGLQTFNFGVPGWGAQQVLRLLELHLEKNELFGQPISQAYFLLIKEHLPRLAGLRLESGGAPRYKFGEGPPKFIGNYPRGAGSLGSACGWSALCEAARDYFRISRMDTYELPPETSRELAGVISRIDDLLRDRYHEIHKLKVLSWNIGDPVMDQLEGDLKERGLEVLSVKDLLPGFPSEDYAFPGDGHPTAKAVDELAKVLSKTK